ncbi:MFS transporter [Acidaminobacter sp. JC074]|uniref:MFS transporter n=1 Tax=Acidaminobacter sp. JC074 TaxID=2530199 RepID=UPI001F0EF673|nr:MFS transporter [Acidaminobacter sp. JC074]MCH4887892.1 MFS transporter [Acidaminobacter sp. JC074]
MGKFLKKNNDPNSLWNNLGKLLILTMAGSFIYTLPYFRFYYYDTFIEAFGLNNTQMGMIGTVYGFFGVLSYLVGGILANKFKTRTLLTFSFISTGLTGLILLTYPSYQIVVAIQAFWGFSTLMTFWPALVKAINMLGNENEKGKSFGFMEGGRGVTNMIHMSLTVALFGFIATQMGDKMGLSSVILFYSVADLLIGVGIFYALRNEASPASEEGASKLDVTMIGRVLKNKYTWMIVTMMFCSYSMNIAYTYFTPYATSQFGSSVVFAAALAVMAQYVRPLAASGSGALGDKIGSSKTFSLGFVLLALGLVGALVIPGSASTIGFLIAAVAACYIAMYSMQALHFTLLEECEYPKELLGVGIGIICTFGYLPEMVIPMVAGKLLDTYPGAAGYRYLFMILLGLAAVGFTTGLVWMRLTKDRRAELLNKNKEKKVAA